MPLPLPWLAGAALALLLSLGGNLWQWRASAAAEARREGEIATAIEQGKRLAAEELAETERKLAEFSLGDRDAILAELNEIAQKAQATRTVYRDRIREIPAATCAPGAERMEAANALLRGE